MQMHAREITPAILVADQPDLDDLNHLSTAGIRGVVNLRQAGEPEQPLDPEREREEVQSRGLHYLHRPMGGAALTKSMINDVSLFIEEQTRDSGRVLVHCRKGGRAVAVVLLALTQQNGWQPGEALERGKELGLVVDGNLKIQVEEYLNHSASQ